MKYLLIALSAAALVAFSGCAADTSSSGGSIAPSGSSGGSIGASH